MQNLKSVIPRKIVLIGASTGGPGQVEKIICALDSLHNTTVVVAQHMVNGFMQSFAKRLENNCHNNVSVVQGETIFNTGHIYICEGNTELKVTATELKLHHKVGGIHSYNPDINFLFNSFVQLCTKSEVLAVILTGIGDDGVKACQLMSENGARCITESEKSAIVDGMPSRARSLVENIEVYNMNEIVQVIREFSE